jgi:hypothetical protein
LNLLDAFCAWLAATPASQTIKTVAWIIPAVQTVHILAVATVMTSVLLINLRLLGVNARELAIASIANRFLPYLWWPLPVLLATGVTLIVAEPSRVLKSPIFQLKMGLLIAAAGVTLVCQIPLQRDAEFWDLNAGRRWAVRFIAIASLSLWIAIVFAGRWIAYVQGT